ncbi:MAG TPA: ROK family protein [Solirubrobacteraceae bacterium]|jgi:predicted NBD/HSP70 family sugar kinase
MGSLEDLRERNRLRIVDALRRHGPATRADLASLTGLSRTTVGSLVDALQGNGLVVESSAEAAGPGRPAGLLRLDAAAGLALGVDFGHRHLRVAVADLSATVLAERSRELDVDAAASTALDAATELCEEVLAAAGAERSRVIAAGMGLPGPIDRRTGTVGSSVILSDWAGLQPAQELSRRLGVAVEVDNDANLGALAELLFGAGQGLRHLVYVKVSSGIGAGLIIDGRLHRGATGIAGELGHVQVRDDGAVCRCGSRGCLETIAGAGALLALMRPAHGERLRTRDMLDLVAAGDPGAARVFDDAGRAIGRALGDLCNCLNPAAVIVGGDLGAAGPLLDGVRAAVDRFAQPRAARAVAVLPARLGERAELLGALALVIGDTERLRSAGLVALNA